jgi:hypothetical protein
MCMTTNQNIYFEFLKKTSLLETLLSHNLVEMFGILNIHGPTRFAHVAQMLENVSIIYTMIQFVYQVLFRLLCFLLFVLLRM